MILYPPLYQCSNGTPRNVESLLSLKTQGFGERPEVYGPGGHNGYDWSCTTDTPVYAMHDGSAVLKEERNPDGTYKGYGLYVILQGSGVQTYYAHLHEAGKLGQVRAGDVIGYSNNSGFSSGPHLHVTCKELDSSGLVKNRNNGHDGAVDFSAWLVWRPAYTDTVKAEEVRDLYRLAFYRDPFPDELAYWTGRPLADFLKTAIADRAVFLARP